MQNIPKTTILKKYGIACPIKLKYSYPKPIMIPKGSASYEFSVGRTMILIVEKEINFMKNK
jgi:hypothetical protein